MKIIFKILIVVGVVLILGYFALNISGIRINTLWFDWLIRKCPQEIKDFGGNACDTWKTPLFEHKVY